MKQHLEKYLPKNPITIDEHNWVYCESKKATFVHEIYEKDIYVKTVQFGISYSKLRKILDSHNKAVAKQSL